MFSYADCDSVEQMRERLRRMIREETAPVHLIGWSLGGMLALEAALEQWERSAPEDAGGAEHLPHPIVRVILIGATLRFAGPDRAKSWPERIVRRMKTQMETRPEETLLRFAESMFSAAEREYRSEYPRWMERLRLNTDFSRQGLDAGLQYLLETDLTGRWSRFASGRSENGSVALPDEHRPDVVWLHGTEDPICPFGAVADIPDRALIVFRGAGHVPFKTEPDLFAEAVRRIVHDYR
jgi:pimeloyl-[acyl-carrier protein] methyl ester esterase